MSEQGIVAFTTLTDANVFGPRGPQMYNVNEDGSFSQNGVRVEDSGGKHHGPPEQTRCRHRQGGKR